jgi:hypothetical protein
MSFPTTPSAGLRSDSKRNVLLGLTNQLGDTVIGFPTFRAAVERPVPRPVALVRVPWWLDADRLEMLGGPELCEPATTGPGVDAASPRLPGRRGADASAVASRPRAVGLDATNSRYPTPSRPGRSCLHCAPATVRWIRFLRPCVADNSDQGWRRITTISGERLSCGQASGPRRLGFWGASR